MEAKLTFRQSLCTTCRICEMACSLKHNHTCNPTRSMVRIVENKKEGISHLQRCRQCRKPPCMEACPVSALSRDSKTGAILVNMQICIGCDVCIQACPFGGIRVDPVERQLLICDLCQGEPACVHWCPTGAVQYTRLDRLSQVQAVGELHS